MELTMDLKFDFIKGSFFANAWRDASQHVKIYLVDDDSFRLSFRTYLLNRTYEIVELYKEKQFSFDDHFQLITDFFNEVNTLFKGKINFSYGCSQKLINVLLKYYWCANMLNGKEPAHMPIDSYILNALNIKDVCWTKMDFETYKDCIKVAKFIAEKAGKSLSEWELITFKEIMEK